MAKLQNIKIIITGGEVIDIKGYSYKGLLIHKGFGDDSHLWVLTHARSGKMLFNDETFAVVKRLGNELSSAFDFTVTEDKLDLQAIRAYYTAHDYDRYHFLNGDM